MKAILPLISLFIALSDLSLKAEVQIDRKLEAEQVALWTQTLQGASYDIPVKRLDKLWLGLRNMGHRMSTGGGAHSPEVAALYTRIQEEMLLIPGHAEYFGKRIREAYEPLKGSHGSAAISGAQNEMMYSFATLKNLPSPKTVRVLGEMLSETWRMKRPLTIPGDYTYTPGSLALSAVESALIYLPLREPPKMPPVMAGEDPEVVMVHPWQSWYAEVKSGRKTFSFKGQSVEYRFKPDGTWETIAMANPPDDEPKPKTSKSEAMRQEKIPSPSPPAQVPPAPPASLPTASPPIYAWIVGTGMLVLTAVAVFLKRRHVPR